MRGEILGRAVTPRPWRPHSQASAEQPGGTAPASSVLKDVYQNGLGLLQVDPPMPRLWPLPSELAGSRSLLGLSLLPSDTSRVQAWRTCTTSVSVHGVFRCTRPGASPPQASPGSAGSDRHGDHLCGA